MPLALHAADCTKDTVDLYAITIAEAIGNMGRMYGQAVWILWPNALSPGENQYF